MKKTSMILPKNISNDVWRDHLDTYSPTLVHNTHEVNDLLSHEHKANISIFDVYLCPLCERNYFVRTPNGIQGNAQFSLDHVPPKSVGGRFKIITCKKCNNDSGPYESELEKTLNFAVDKKDPKALVIPDIKVEDVSTGKYIRGTMVHKNNRTDVVFNEKAKEFNSKYIEFLSDLKSKKLQLHIELFNQDKLQRALLKSAYLLCFIWWGYQFVFSPNGRLIRKAINGELKYPVPMFFLHEKQKAPTEVCLLEYESKRLAFLVNIELEGIDAKTTASLIIPNPTDQGWSSLEETKKLIDNDPKKFTFIPLPRVVHRIGYYVSWNIVL